MLLGRSVHVELAGATGKEIQREESGDATGGEVWREKPEEGIEEERPHDEEEGVTREGWAHKAKECRLAGCRHEEGDGAGGEGPEEDARVSMSSCSRGCTREELQRQEGKEEDGMPPRTGLSMK